MIWGWSEPGACRRTCKGREPGTCRRTCKGRVGWLLAPGSNCVWELQMKPNMSCRGSLVCCGATDSWLISHHKIAVSGLGESSPGQCPPFKTHGFTELLWIQPHWFLCKKRLSKLWQGISKNSLQNSRGFTFHPKVSFWISALFQVMLKSETQIALLGWSSYQRKSHKSCRACMQRRWIRKTSNSSFFLFLRSILWSVTVLAAARPRCPCCILLLLAGCLSSRLLQRNMSLLIPLWHSVLAFRR